MALTDIIKKRQSVRNFQSKQIQDPVMKDILEAGRMAPSAVNFQPWRFIVIDNIELLEQISQAYPREWFKTASQVIVVCGNHNESWKRKSDDKDHCDIDVAIAIDHITLAAAEKGIGTCWVCNFDPVIVSKVLNLPDEIEPIALLPIGYPTEELLIENKMRKPLSQIAFKNTLENPY